MKKLQVFSLFIFFLKLIFLFAKMTENLEKEKRMRIKFDFNGTSEVELTVKAQTIVYFIEEMQNFTLQQSVE